WTSHQLFISTITHARHRPHAWNGFVCECLIDINEKLPKGSHWKLTEFIATHQETLQHDFVQLMEMHKHNYAIIHDQPKVVQRKMTAAFETMDKEWSSSCSSLSIEGFYIAVCGGVEDLSPPKIFFSPKGNKFVHSVLDLKPRCFALKLESFVVSGLGNYFKATA
ncbi:hypothetical protein SCLCIDRAFT_132049, partial [Scleroderma citrinum Foug A]